MPRINIEDSLFRDIRFFDLCLSVGSRSLAIGLLVEAWIVAQKFFLEFGEIPQAEWEEAKLNNKIIEFGLACKTDTGVKMRGQDNQFAWLKLCQDAGRKGGKGRPQGTLTKANPSLTSSSSSSSTTKNTYVESKQQNQPTKTEIQKPKNGTDVPRCELFFKELWNTKVSPSVRRVSVITERRARCCAARWRDRPDESYWAAVIDRINSTPFLLGEGKGGWLITFDFFIRPDSHIKIMEGTYERPNDYSDKTVTPV